MAVTTVPAAPPAPIPRLGYLLILFPLAVLWVVLLEAGPISHALGQAGTFLHEVFHDGRHLVGVPCH